VANGSSNVLTSSNGTTWASSSLLPAATSNYSTILWDGSDWVVIDHGNYAVYKTSVSAGTSGWTTAVSAYTGPVLNNANGTAGTATPYCVNTSTGTIVGVQGVSNGSTFGSTGQSGEQPITIASTSQMTSTTYSCVQGCGPLWSPRVWWNGFCYILLISSLRGPNMYTSADGIKWNLTQLPLMPGGSIYPLQNTVGYGIGGDGSNIFSSSPVNTTTGGFVLLGGSGTISVKYLPTCTPSTQFCLPKEVGTPKSWIRAL
jgi:hypothetical protein